MDSTLLLASGYFVTLAGLNAICYLISAFWQKKFDEPSPKAGFLIGVIVSAILAGLVFLPAATFPAQRLVLVGLVLVGGIIIATNTISLYSTMKKIRK